MASASSSVTAAALLSAEKALGAALLASQIDVADRVAFFQKWLTVYSTTYASVQAELTAAVTSGGDGVVTTDFVQSKLRELENHLEELHSELARTALFIAARVPEFKEEDNVGVQIQQAVLKAIRGAQDAIQGGSGGSGKDESAGGASSLPCHLGSEIDFLQRRLSVIEKRSKPAAATAAATPAAADAAAPGEGVGPAQEALITEILNGINKDTCRDLARSYQQLRFLAVSCGTVFYNNREKVVRPRGSSGRPGML